MSQNSESMHKFRALMRLDEFFGEPDADRRDEHFGLALERLADPNFDVMGRTVAGVHDLPSGPMPHLQDHWLSGRYFPGVDPAVIRDSLRDGYRAAIEDARKARLPLNSVWVCGSADSKSSDFRVDHVVGPHSVTVAIITPPRAVKD